MAYFYKCSINVLVFRLVSISYDNFLHSTFEISMDQKTFFFVSIQKLTLKFYQSVLSVADELFSKEKRKHIFKSNAQLYNEWLSDMKFKITNMHVFSSSKFARLPKKLLRTSVCTTSRCIVQTYGQFFSFVSFISYKIFTFPKKCIIIRRTRAKMK